MSKDNGNGSHFPKATLCILRPPSGDVVNIWVPNSSLGISTIISPVNVQWKQSNRQISRSGNTLSDSCLICQTILNGQ